MSSALEDQSSSRSSSSRFHFRHQSRTHPDPGPSHYSRSSSLDGIQAADSYPSSLHISSAEIKDKAQTHSTISSKGLIGLSDFCKTQVWSDAVMEMAGMFLFEFALVAANQACYESHFKHARLAEAVFLGLIWSCTYLGMLTLSVAHMNPAFTLTSMLTGFISPVKAIVNICFQCIGSILGSWVAREVLKANSGRILGGCILKSNMGQHDGQALAASLILEIAFTFLLISVAYATTLESDNLNITGPIVGASTVGAALTFLVFISSSIRPASYSGAGMNPAHCLGPAVVGGRGGFMWANHWIFWTGPFIAAAMFGLLYHIAIPKVEHDTHLVSRSQNHVFTPAAPFQNSKLDVFLHIKAMVHRSEGDKERRSVNNSREVIVEQS